MKLLQKYHVDEWEIPSVSVGGGNDSIGYWTSEITEFSPAKGMATPATLQLLLPVTPFCHHSLGPTRGKVTRQPVKHTTSPNAGLAAVYGDKHMSRMELRHYHRCRCSFLRSPSALAAPHELTWAVGVTSKSCTSRREIRSCQVPSVST